MGDIADYYIEQMIDKLPHVPTSNYVVCFRCHKSIELLNNGVRWRAYERGALKPHRCNPPIDPSEFTAIT